MQIKMQDQTDDSLPRPAGRHAVVIGGSIAGLLTARVLSDYFEHVTVIERDTFPEGPVHRKGVPQSYHSHNLLPRGKMIVERLFPGILADLQKNGATLAKGNVAFVTPAGKLPSLPPRDGTQVFSRVLLEWQIRQRVVQSERVDVIAHTDAIGLVMDEAKQRVLGVHVRERDTARHERDVLADFVVDASGRTSQAPCWLTEQGYEAPVEEIIHSGLAYGSRVYKKPEHFPAEWVGIIINGRPPHNARACLILPIENDCWHVSLGGIGGESAPVLDEEGFLQFARELADPSIYEALRVAEPLTPIRGYRTPSNRIRHYERLRRWPAGFIVIGDAVCAINPLHGQGMTAIAMEALALDKWLRTYHQQTSGKYEQTFQKQLLKAVMTPWSMAMAEDLRWPGVRRAGGVQPSIWLRLRHRYMDFVLRNAVEDIPLTIAYLMVLGLLVPAGSLVHSRVVLRLLQIELKRLLRRFSKGSASGTQLALSPSALEWLRAQPTKVFHESHV